MSRSRIWAIALRIVRQFRRDHRTLALLFIVPLVVLTILGPLIDTKVPIRLALSDRDEAMQIPTGRGQPPVERKFSEQIVEALAGKDGRRQLADNKDEPRPHCPGS